MANMQSPEKIRVGLLIDRTVAARLVKGAKQANLSRNAYANAIIDDALSSIRLTKAEKELVDEEIRKIRRTRRSGN